MEFYGDCLPKDRGGGGWRAATEKSSFAVVSVVRAQRLEQ